MFTESGCLAERYEAAKQCGFKAVECQFPYSSDPEILAAARKASGLTHVLINSYPGDMTKGEFGFACLPGQESAFKKSIETSLVYAKALNCRKIHVVAGPLEEHDDFETFEETYLKNLEYVAEIFKEAKILGLIEPLCPAVRKTYFLSSFEKAIEYVKKIDSDSLRILLDVYHLQMLSNSVSRGIREAFPYAGHVQISQAPGRQEPNFPGCINYKEVFQDLEIYGYKDYIGLEYFPSETTKSSLNWIKELNCEL